MLNFLSALIGPLFKTIDSVIDNKDHADRIKMEIQQKILTHHAEEFRVAANIIVAEANGESWLQRNWRPVLMLWFAGLVGAHWLGFTAPNLSESTVGHLLDIVKIGVGGYVIGRSGEKIAKEASKVLQNTQKNKSENIFNS